MENTAPNTTPPSSSTPTFKQNELFSFSQPAGGTRSEASLLFDNYGTSGFEFRNVDPEPALGRAQAIVYQISCRSNGSSASNAMCEEDTVAEVTLEDAYRRLAKIREPSTPQVNTAAGEQRVEGGPDGVLTNGFHANRDEAGPSDATEMRLDRQQTYSEEGTDDPHVEVTDDPHQEGPGRAFSDRSRSGLDKEKILVIELTGGIKQAPFDDFAPDYSGVRLAKFASGDEQGQGVFIRGVQGTSKSLESATILVRIPYIGFKKNTQGMPAMEEADSWESAEYRGNVIERNGEMGEMIVHQALFAVFDMGAVLAIRRRTKHNNHPIVLPNQERTGAFHLLVQMIKEMIRNSDKNLIKKFGSAAAVHERRALFGEPSDASEVREDLENIIIAEDVLNDQVTILDSLEKVFGLAEPDKVTQTANSILTSNMFPVPVLSGGDIRNTKKQLWHVFAFLKDLLKQRRELQQQCATFLARIRAAHVENKAEQLPMAVEELKVSQERQMVEMNMQLEAQGKKISLITYVTLLCLPLATLSQYFALPYYEGQITPKMFWWTTGSIMLVFGCIGGFSVLRSRYDWRELLRAIRGWRRPMTREDVMGEAWYFKTLPLVKVVVKAVENVTPAGLPGCPVDMNPRYLQWPTMEKEKPQEGQVRVGTEEHLFRWDRERGLLFVNMMDAYGCLYHVRLLKENQLWWKWTRLPREKMPYFFHGRFGIELKEVSEARGYLPKGCKKRCKELLVWKTAAGDSGKQRWKRWDHKTNALSCFFVANDGLSVSTTPNPPEPHYTLELLPVLID